MLYSITIQDIQGKPIPGGLLTFTRGGVVLTMMTADAKGLISFDDAEDNGLLQDDVTAMASAPGYNSLGVAASSISPDWYFGLVPKPKTGLYIIGGLVGAAALVAVFASGKRKGGTVGGFWDGMTGGQKIAIVGAVGLGAYLLLFKKDDSAKLLAQSAAAELQKLAQQGVTPTITNTQAEDFSSALVTAFDDCGTDNATVTAVFSALRNQADILLLVSTYGVRDYKGCFDGDWFSDHSRNLAQALTSELSGSELSDINSMLSARGITYQF